MRNIVSGESVFTFKRTYNEIHGVGTKSDLSLALLLWARGDRTGFAPSRHFFKQSFSQSFTRMKWNEMNWNGMALHFVTARCKIATSSKWRYDKFASALSFLHRVEWYVKKCFPFFCMPFRELPARPPLPTRFSDRGENRTTKLSNFSCIFLIHYRWPEFFFVPFSSQVK